MEGETVIARLLRPFGRLPAQRPALCLLFALATTAVAAFQLPKWFTIETDISTMYPGNSEVLELRRLAAAKWTSPKSMLVVIRSDDLERDLSDAARLLRGSGLLEDVLATQSEFAAAESGSEASAPLFQLPIQSLERIRTRLTRERRATLEGLQQQVAEDPMLGLQLARRDPLGLRWILSEARALALPGNLDAESAYLRVKNGRTGFLIVRATKPVTDLDFTVRLIDDVELRLDSLDVDYDLLGAYPTAKSDAARLERDMRQSAIWSLVLVGAFLALSIRHWRAPLTVCVPVLVAILWTLSFGGLILGPMTPIAAGAAAILAGLGVDFGVHWLGRYREERQDKDHAGATMTATLRTGPPMIAAMITTSGAFLALRFSDFQGLWSFGALLSLGLAFSLLVTLLVSPLLAFKRKSPPRQSLVITGAERIVSSRFGAPILSVTIAIALAGWGTALFAGLDFDASSRLLRPASDPVIEGIDRLEADLGFTPVPLTLLVPVSTSADSLLAGMRALEAEGAIEHSGGAHRALANTERQTAVRALRQDIEGWKAAALGDLDELGFDSEVIRPALDELNEALAKDPQADPKLRASYRDKDYHVVYAYPEGTLWERAERTSIRDSIARHLPEGTRMTGPVGLSDELTVMMRSDLLRCAGIATVVIVVGVFLAMGSFWAGLLAMLPMFAGIGLTLGWLAWTGSTVHLGNFAALPLILGIGIDDGIHMVARFRESRRVARSTVLRTTGMSVWRTSATTTLAFGSLVFSESPGLASLGALLTIGVVTCFVTSVLLLTLLKEPENEPAPTS